jgi:hypothetical protein
MAVQKRLDIAKTLGKTFRVSSPPERTIELVNPVGGEYTLTVDGKYAGVLDLKEHQDTIEFRYFGIIREFAHSGVGSAVARGIYSRAAQLGKKIRHLGVHRPEEARLAVGLMEPASIVLGDSITKKLSDPINPESFLLNMDYTLIVGVNDEDPNAKRYGIRVRNNQVQSSNTPGDFRPRVEGGKLVVFDESGAQTQEKIGVRLVYNDGVFIEGRPRAT